MIAFFSFGLIFDVHLVCSLYSVISQYVKNLFIQDLVYVSFGGSLFEISLSSFSGSIKTNFPDSISKKRYGMFHGKYASEAILIAI